MTNEELIKRFPRASRSFLRQNSDRVAGSESTDWTEDEKDMLRAYYHSTPPLEFSVDAIATRLKRTKAAISVMASRLGLPSDHNRKGPKSADALRRISESSSARQTSDMRQAASVRMKQWHAEHAHPKGYSGRKHGPETLAKISAKSSAWQQSMSTEERKAIARVRQQTAVANGQSLSPRVRRGSWRAAWVDIGGKKFFSRSAWEADYARFLEWQKERRLITDWDYEPRTFWFPVKRGLTNYTPDFSVTKANGSVEYHEVKGWLDARSKTKLNRMRIHHPGEIMRLIDAAWFKANRGFLKGIRSEKVYSKEEERTEIEIHQPTP